MNIRIPVAIGIFAILGLFGYVFFNHLFVETPSQNFIPNALHLYNQGFDYLSPVLDEKNHHCYTEDKEYIGRFPLSDYPVVELANHEKFYIDSINDTIKNCLRAHIPWEVFHRGLIERYTKPGTIAIDIGAHIGTHTLTMSKCVGPTGKVFAFEPNKKIFRELCMNLAINQTTNVYPLRCAIGKEKGTITVIASHPNNEGGSYVINKQMGINTAAIIPLDAFQLTNISFIKIDVENMEEEVLDGAIATINQNRPIMLIEIQGNYERPLQLGEDSNQKARDSIAKILKLGYRLQRVGTTNDYLAFP